MIILSDEHYVLPHISTFVLLTPTLLAKEALRLLDFGLTFKYWCILDSTGKPYLTKRTGQDKIKIRNPPRFDLTSI